MAAAGEANLFTSPPLSAERINTLLADVAGRFDLLYFNLHGFADQPNYYGQQDGVIGPTAVTPEIIAKNKPRQRQRRSHRQSLSKQRSAGFHRLHHRSLRQNQACNL